MVCHSTCVLNNTIQYTQQYRILSGLTDSRNNSGYLNQVIFSRTFSNTKLFRYQQTYNKKSSHLLSNNTVASSSTLQSWTTPPCGIDIDRQIETWATFALYTREQCQISGISPLKISSKNVQQNLRVLNEPGLRYTMPLLHMSRQLSFEVFKIPSIMELRMHRRPCQRTYPDHW